jgi:hypothetical protein
VIAGGRLSAKHAARDTDAATIGLMMGGGAQDPAPPPEPREAERPG